jgi:hypothetical protein
MHTGRLIPVRESREGVTATININNRLSAILAALVFIGFGFQYFGSNQIRSTAKLTLRVAFDHTSAEQAKASS